MALRAKAQFSCGGGGGNFIGGANPIPFGTVIQPLAGDFLLVVLNAQFGLNTPTPTQPSFKFYDDAGNVWINLIDYFNINPSTMGYEGQFSLSVWVCKNATGKPIGNFWATSTVVPDAFDVNGTFSYSDWTNNWNGQPVRAANYITSSTATPTTPTIAVAPNEIVYAGFMSLDPTVSGAATPPSGFTTLTNDGTGGSGYYDFYVTRSKSTSIAATMGSPTASTIWQTLILSIDISPPSLKVSQTFMNLRPMAIED